MRKIFTRRTDTELCQVGTMDDGFSRYYDHNMEMTVVKIFSGDCYVTNQEGEVLITVLGSCVAACIRDPITKIGGMNHFLLPGDYISGGYLQDSALFGAYAMEQLINGLIKLGADKNRLEVKLFGGGNVINNSTLMGDKNAEFAKDFIENENLIISSQDLGGSYPRRIHYYPDSGKVMMRVLRRKEDMQVTEKEKQYLSRLRSNPLDGEAELFKT